MSKKRNEWAPLPLRLILGGSFMAAGLLKLVPPGGPGYQNIVHELTAFGVPMSEGVGWIVGIVEFSSGLALVVGALVRILSAFNALQLLGLLFIGLVRGGIPEALPDLQFFPYQLPGYHLSILTLGGLLALLISGAGAYSVDGFLAARRADTTS